MPIEIDQDVATEDTHGVKFGAEIRGGMDKDGCTPDIKGRPDEAIVSEDEAAALAVDVVAEEAHADEVQEYTKVIEEDIPHCLVDFRALTLEHLMKARKAKNYQAEVWFACLADFSHWLPRQGRISASKRVSRNHGRGKWFA